MEIQTGARPVWVGTFGWWEYTCSGDGWGALPIPMLGTREGMWREVGTWPVDDGKVKKINL